MDGSVLEGVFDAMVRCVRTQISLLTGNGEVRGVLYPVGTTDDEIPRPPYSGELMRRLL